MTVTRCDQTWGRDPSPSLVSLSQYAHIRDIFLPLIFKTKTKQNKKTPQTLGRACGVHSSLKANRSLRPQVRIPDEDMTLLLVSCTYPGTLHGSNQLLHRAPSVLH